MHRGELWASFMLLMGVTSLFVLTPCSDIANNGLAHLLDVHVRHCDGLFAAVAVLSQGFRLCGERTRQLVEAIAVDLSHLKSG